MLSIGIIFYIVKILIKLKISKKLLLSEEKFNYFNKFCIIVL